MNSLIILMITFKAPELIFHLSYQVALFRISVLVNQSHTIFYKLYMPSIFTISNLISKSSSSHSSYPINLAAFKKLKYTISPIYS